MTKQHPVENDVKKAIKKIFDKHDWFWWAVAAGAFSTSGISDFHAIKHGVFIAVEAKSGKNTPTAAQRGFLSSIAAADGFAFVVNEERLPVLDAFLTAFEATKTRIREGHTTVSQDDEVLMMNCIRSLGWEIITGDTHA